MNIVKFLVILIFSIAVSQLFLAAPVHAGIIVVVILAAFFITNVKIEYFLYAFIFLYPIMPFHAGIDLGYMFPVVKPQRVIAAFLIICWLRKKDLSQNMKSFFKFPPTLILFALATSYLLSYLSNANIRSFIFDTGSFVFENFMIAFIFYDVLREKSDAEIKNIFLLIFASCIIPLCLGIGEYFTGFNIFSLVAPYRSALLTLSEAQSRLGTGRVRVAFPHSIDYGIFFALTVPAGLVFAGLSEAAGGIKQFLYKFYVLGVGFVGTFLSLSRIALAVYIFIFVVMASCTGLVSAFILMLSFFSIISFLGLIFNIEAINRLVTMIASTMSPGSANIEMAQSTYARFLQLKFNIGKIMQSPVLGYGKTYYPGILDNYYLSLILKIGFIGTVIYLLFFILPAGLSLAALLSARDKFYRIVSLAVFLVVLSTLAIFCVLSITDYVYLTWIYIGIFFAIRHKRRSVASFSK